jgi:chromosome segregation ATPase
MSASGRERPYRYPLQALLAQQGWHVDALSQELASARSALQQQERAAEQLQQELQGLNHSLARLRADGQTLDLAREQRLLAWRAAQEEALQQQQAQVESARRLCERIADQLARARQALKGYENHRDGLQAQHRIEHARVQARVQDDEWLVLRRWHEGNR